MPIRLPNLFGGVDWTSGASNTSRLILEGARAEASAIDAKGERRREAFRQIGSTIAGVKERKRQDGYRAEAKAERDEDRAFRQAEAGRDNDRANLQLLLSMEARDTEREMRLMAESQQAAEYGTSSTALGELEQLRAAKKNRAGSIQALQGRVTQPQEQPFASPAVGKT